MPRPAGGCPADPSFDLNLGRRAARAVVPERVPQSSGGSGCDYFYYAVCGPITEGDLADSASDACCYLLVDGGETCGAS